jgi:predicted aldo/keto reductase-like oxidoreductase
MAVAEDARVADEKVKVADYFAYKADKYGWPASDAESQAVKDVPNGALVNTCYTCHEKRFCNDCHGGIEMPHPTGYVNNHVEDSKTKLDACGICHGGGTENFCTVCHHSDPYVKGYTFDSSLTWLAQHWFPCETDGAAQCFDCHKPTDCAICHVRGSGSVN